MPHWRKRVIISAIIPYSPLICSNYHDDVIKWKHFPRYWPFVRGIHRWPVNSPHKGQWRGALAFSVIWAWINGWVNNGEAGDLRRYRAIYDVTVMWACAISKQGLANIHVVTTHLPVVMSNKMGKTRFKKLMTLFWLSVLVIFGDIKDGVSYLLCSLGFSGLASSSVSIPFPTMLCQCIAAFGIPLQWCRVWNSITVMPRERQYVSYYRPIGCLFNS